MSNLPGVAELSGDSLRYASAHSDTVIFGGGLSAFMASRIISLADVNS